MTTTLESTQTQTLRTSDRIFRLTFRTRHETRIGYATFSWLEDRGGDQLYAGFSRVDVLGLNTMGSFGACHLPKDGRSFEAFGVVAVEPIGVRLSQLPKGVSGVMPISEAFLLARAA